jgi:hypothetical protein
MKNTLAIVCLIGSTLALSACAGSNSDQTTTPYDRTAVYGHNQSAAAENAVTPAEPMFHKSQTK